MIVNLTPHDVNVISPSGEVRTFATSGQVAKVTEESISGGDIEGIPACTKVYGDVVVLDRDEFLAKISRPHIEPMPAEQDDVYLIVPMLVGQVLAGTRRDLIGPDYGIGGAMRDKTGQITGASGFIRY